MARAERVAFRFIFSNRISYSHRMAVYLPLRLQSHLQPIAFLLPLKQRPSLRCWLQPPLPPAHPLPLQLLPLPATTQ